jgi:hypothetical protein
MQGIFSKFRKRSKRFDFSPFIFFPFLDSIQRPIEERQEQNEESTSTNGLLLSNDSLPMVHNFEDLFENSSAMLYFMKFLEENGEFFANF